MQGQGAPLPPTAEDVPRSISLTTNLTNMSLACAPTVAQLYSCLPSDLSGGGRRDACCLHRRSIYPDEFDNFVERMRTANKRKGKEFLFDVDVIDPMMDVVLNVELGSETSRSG